jgi:hypothetical protein
VKQIIVYESTDGSRWDHKYQAMQRDTLNTRVEAIERALPKIPSEGKRVAVNIELVRAAKREVVQLCREQFPDERIFKHEPSEDIHPLSYAGRFLDYVGGPLDRVWRWFAFERDGWLYSQPFYAMNPDKFEEAK